MHCHVELTADMLLLQDKPGGELFREVEEKERRREKWGPTNEGCTREELVHISVLCLDGIDGRLGRPRSASQSLRRRHGVTVFERRRIGGLRLLICF